MRVWEEIILWGQWGGKGLRLTLGRWQVRERWPLNNLKQYMRDMRYSTTWKQWERKRVFSWNTQHENWEI